MNEPRVITIDPAEDVVINGTRLSGAFFGPEAFGVKHYPGRWFQVESRRADGALSIRCVSERLAQLFDAWAGHREPPLALAWPSVENSGHGWIPPAAEPNLGYATTRELLAELHARASVDGRLDYRTVD